MMGPRSGSTVNANADGLIESAHLLGITALDALALIESYIPSARDHKYKVSAVTVAGRLRDALVDCGQLADITAAVVINPEVAARLERAAEARRAAHRRIEPLETPDDTERKRVLLERLRSVSV